MQAEVLYSVSIVVQTGSLCKYEYQDITTAKDRGRHFRMAGGIQHQDGHSQVIANTYPILKSYDPAFAY